MLAVEFEVVVTILVGTAVDTTVALDLVVLTFGVGCCSREVVWIGVLVDVTGGSSSSSRSGVLGALSWTASILRGGGLALRLKWVSIRCLSKSR